MRLFFIIVTLTTAFLTMPVQGQDLIVTTTGDSINCKITRQRADFVYFTYMKERQVQNTLIPAEQVAALHRKFYSTPEIPAGTVVKTRTGQWVGGLYGGYSYRLSKLSDKLPYQFKDHYKKLKSGLGVGGDVHYFFSENLGFGVRYDFNRYTNNEPSIADEEIKMHYIGLSMLNRLTLKNDRKRLYTGLNMGYQSYGDMITGRMYPSGVHITGKTMGIGFEIGYGEKIGAAGELYGSIGMQAASLYKLIVDSGGVKQKLELEKDEAEGLSRLELRIGLKFGK